MRTHRHTHTHTRVRAWHGPGTRGDAPRHMHTHGWTDRSPRMSAGGRRGARGPELPVRGAVLAASLDHLGALGLVPGGKHSVLLGAGHWRRSASPGSSQAARHRSGRPPDAPGFAGPPTTASSSCGIEFSAPFALRVSMPLGGKYKRCLCLKPNMGVRESPGLGPSFGPGLLATEGWAETRGRPPSYAQHGSSV